MREVSFDEAVPIVREGGVGVVPTDTLYGIVASALSEKAVERVYGVRGRSEDKPCIILIPNQDALEMFDVVPTEKMRAVLQTYWPGAVSIILPCESERFSYLHRGTRTLAFRVPDPTHRALISFLEQTGPIIAPSANPQGSVPASTMLEAYGYFSNNVDCYVNGGTLAGKPSTVLSIVSDRVQLVRQGTVPFIELKHSV